MTASTARLFMMDKCTKQQFLVVDIGSDLCCFSLQTHFTSLGADNYDLCTASGTTIPTYGWLPLSLNMALSWNFTWQFLVADITHHLIGANFQFHCGLLVDCKNNLPLYGISSLIPSYIHAQGPQNSPHVFLHQDATCSLYRVLSRKEKMLQLILCGNPVMVSSDGVKPAYIINDADCGNTPFIPTAKATPSIAPLTLTLPTPTTRITCSGHHVHFPLSFIA
jgi:hypothetical protein